MKISPATETLNYLKETRAIINQSINLSGQRNKTLKIIAAIGTFKLLLMRIEAAITGTISGMGDDLTVGSIIIQKSIYDPILEYWIKELMS
jgi:hypothetical protein